MCFYGFFQTVLWKGVLKISKKSKKNTYARVFFWTKFQASGLQFYLKKRLYQRCFPVDFANFLEQLFLLEHLQWLLPTAKSRKHFFAKKAPWQLLENLLFTERNFQVDFIWLKSKAASAKFLHGFIFLDGKSTDIVQIGFRVLFKNFKNLISSLDCLILDCLSVIWLKDGLLIVLTKLL